MSLSPPSHVSATTGNDHSSWSIRPRRTTHSITASRTTPTECVFVIITGPHRNPDSSTQVVPVISPLPFIVNQPANTGSSASLPRGKIAVTPWRAPSDLAFAAPVPAVIPGPGGVAPARRSLRPRGRGRAPAGHVRGCGGPLGPAAFHGVLDRRGIVARDARPARTRVAAPWRRVCGDAGRDDRARADVRLRRGERDLWRARYVADAPGAWRTGDGLVGAVESLTAGGDLRGAAVPRAARGRA